MTPINSCTLTGLLHSWAALPNSYSNPSVPSRKAVCTIFMMVFSMTWPWCKPWLTAWEANTLTTIKAIPTRLRYFYTSHLQIHTLIFRYLHTSHLQIETGFSHGLQPCVTHTWPAQVKAGQLRAILSCQSNTRRHSLLLNMLWYLVFSLQNLKLFFFKYLKTGWIKKIKYM